MKTDTPSSHDENIKKINELIKGIEFAMLTTQDPDGNLHSRPMGTQKIDFDGTFWFFTGRESAKIHAIENDAHVNLAYSHPSRNTYVSIAGVASLVEDRAKAEELWTPAMKAWFPEGLEDPNLALLRVDPLNAQYWDAPHSSIVQFIGFTKAILTGKPYSGGENKKINLHQQ